ATFSIEGVSGATNIAMTESNGTYTGTYTVQAGDNVKDATVSVTFTKEGQTQTDTSQKVTIDTTPPTIQITSPADGSFTNQTSIEVQGTVSDDNLDTVTVNGVQATVTDGSFTAQIDLPDGDGDKTITATATDVVGHESSDSIAVILDTTPPQIQITQPVDGSWTNQTSITVTGTVSDANLDTVTVNGVQATVTDGSFTAQGVQLQEGDNTITATATDKAANTAQVTVTVKLDTVKPSLSNPTAQPTVVKNGDTITVTVEATDEGSGIASVTANVDGIDTGAAGHTSFVLNPVEGQQNVYSGTYTISQNNTASNNDYKIVITATDYAGNTQTDDTTTVTLRNLNITLQSDKSAIPPGGEAILTATLTDASGAGLEGETVEIGFAPDSQNKKGDLSSVEDIGNGQYQCTYTAPQDFEGQISFIATVDGVTSEVLTIIVRSITMEITVDPDTLVACGTQTATVTVTMLDENNDPISGEEIKFTVSDDNGSIDPETGTTGDDGKCTVTYTAGIQAGTATITATAQGPKAQGVSATAQVTLTPAGIDPDGSTLTVQPGEVSADDPTVTVTVRVVDVHGNPISGASVKILVDGKKVEILMDGTGVPTATTDQNGRLVAQIQLPHQAGDKTISTTANDTILTQIVTVKVTPGKLASLEISPDTALVPIGRTRQFTVTGADAEGNPITPTDVTWEVIGEIGTIDQNGLFTATTEGVGKIQATADGVTDTTGDIKVVTRIPGDCAGGSQTADFPNGEPDGKVDIFDLVQMGSHWHQTAENTTATQAEFEAMDIAGPSSWEQGDGVIDIFDLIVLADNFGVGTGAAAPDLIARLPILSTAKLALITPTTRTTMQRESEIRTLLGSEFKLDLLAEGLKGLKGYTFQIAYDPNAFEILGDGGKRFAEGSLMKGMESFSFAKPDRSSLTAAGVVLGRESVRVDSGTLGSLSLKAKSAGEHTIVLRNVILIMDDGKSFTLPELRYRVIVHEPIEKTKLLQNYPNPFNPETWIPFQLKEASEVTIRIYDLHGNLI
ncbi:Ig-like domain-containing protein, partial [Candidatus Poribacteria bacterium]|nr:Ig-like domain-containing protein [Candidatus Poribacteria bacterium]